MVLEVEGRLTLFMPHLPVFKRGIQCTTVQNEAKKKKRKGYSNYDLILLLPKYLSA